VAKSYRNWLNTLKTAGTWEIVERPLNTNIVDSKWVFRVKKDANGNIPNGSPTHLHADLRRFTVYYFETFAPVAKLASIRSILAIRCLQPTWDITMFDFH